MFGQISSFVQMVASMRFVLRFNSISCNTLGGSVIGDDKAVAVDAL